MFPNFLIPVEFLRRVWFPALPQFLPYPKNLAIPRLKLLYFPSAGFVPLSLLESFVELRYPIRRSWDLLVFLRKALGTSYLLV